MPKIIENLENRLMEEAKKQIAEVGYSAMTIRSVAKACGVGVGTVYNYFPSKDDLLAAYMLKDWNLCICAIDAVGAYADSPASVMRCIYDQLQNFTNAHRLVFQDAGAGASFAGSFSRYHGLLRNQLARPLARFCGSGFTAEFVAEALLTWTVAGKPFDEIYDILKKII